MTSLRRMLSLSSSSLADDGDPEVGRRTDRERSPLLEGDDGGNNYSGENGTATGTGIASGTDTLFSLSREESMVDPGIVASRRNLTTFAGVFSPVALSMFSTALFLRLGFVLGQSGLILTLLQLGLAYLILYLTILSICAISTNGQVQGGGAYYMISRALGPEFGGSIGLLFFLANVFSCALYVSGFVEGLIDNFGPGGTFVGSSGGLEAGNRWWTYLYCTVVLALCLLVCFIGSTMFARTSVFIFMIVTGVIVTVVVSMFAVGERCVPYPDTNPRLHPVPNDTNITVCANYTGFSLQTFMDNMYDRYTVDYITGKNMNFSVVFAILFSSVTGIMNGANMSGELKNPSKSIPKGTLGATTFALGVYVILTFLTSFTCERDLLVNNYIFLQPINMWPPFIVIGIFATTLSAALGNLIGASRILEALANDELFWMILKPAKFATKGANPIGAVLISWFLVQLVLLIGSLNAIAPVTSSFFLLSYASTNLACLALDLASAPNFRPTFKYFTSHTSFLGLLGCMIMCFIINPIYASIALVVCMLLVITLHLRVYPESWGSISQALIFHQVRKYLLLLDSRKDHVKYWRPQMLLLVNNPRSCSVLIDFINDIKKGGLYVLGHVKVGDFDDMPTDPCQVDMLNWLGLVDSLKVKAFVELTIADSVRDGMNHLVRVSGLGGMKPNTICLGFYDSTQPDDLLSVQLDRKQRRGFRRTQNQGENDDMTSRFPEPRDNGADKPLSVNEYVHMIADIFKMNKNVCLFRYFEQLDKQAIFNSRQPRYIDVWPVNFFQPQTSHYFDNTCLFLLQLACILHMVPGWKSHTILRVFLCVETQTSDVTRIETKLRQILTDLRILGQVKIVTWEHVTRHIGVTASATRDGVVLPPEYLVALNELVKNESRNTAMVFTYLPKVPVSEAAWSTYLDQLSVITADLPPTVLVHGVHTVVSTTL